MGKWFDMKMLVSTKGNRGFYINQQVLLLTQTLTFFINISGKGNWLPNCVCTVWLFQGKINFPLKLHHVYPQGKLLSNWANRVLWLTDAGRTWLTCGGWRTEFRIRCSNQILLCQYHRIISSGHILVMWPSAFRLTKRYTKLTYTVLYMTVMHVSYKCSTSE